MSRLSAAIRSDHSVFRLVENECGIVTCEVTDRPSDHLRIDPVLLPLQVGLLVEHFVPFSALMRYSVP